MVLERFSLLPISFSICFESATNVRVLVTVTMRNQVFDHDFARPGKLENADLQHRNMDSHF